MNDAIQLELFTNRFRAIAGEMGEMLRRTAISTNIKERLDYSCALLDARGELVVNAPHIPVHLGAMALCVQTVARAVEMKPGDVVVTNHPAFGGSHLPDVTVITPVFAGERLVGYTASRSHHAEIGGKKPGSMPPDATRLVDEGVVIEPMHLMRAGEQRWDAMEAMLAGGPWPSRCIDDNLADLRAAVAANRQGADALLKLVRTHGADAVEAMMDGLKSRAERRMRETFARIGDRTFEAEEFMDDGTPLRVRIAIAGGEAVVDFTGSGAVHPGNLNAGPAIVHAAVIYVLRLLASGENPPLPLNSGLLRPVRMVIPEGTLLNPARPAHDYPAVVGGNIETSQRLVGALIKALGIAASSAGTMNNVLFGNARFGYYETVCGGSGATANADGASAVHTHMTNTRITDPEVLERRYPVRVEEFSVRANSGGLGRHRGGDGIVRKIRFLEPMSLSVLTQHRVRGPFGMEGGGNGAPGRRYVLRANGERIDLASVDGCDVEAGDLFVLETPGGGGFGTRE